MKVRHSALIIRLLNRCQLIVASLRITPTRSIVDPRRRLIRLYHSRRRASLHSTLCVTWANSHRAMPLPALVMLPSRCAFSPLLRQAAPTRRLRRTRHGCPAVRGEGLFGPLQRGGEGVEAGEQPLLQRLQDYLGSELVGVVVTVGLPPLGVLAQGRVGAPISAGASSTTRTTIRKPNSLRGTARNGFKRVRPEAVQLRVAGSKSATAAWRFHTRRCPESRQGGTSRSGNRSLRRPWTQLDRVGG